MNPGGSPLDVVADWASKLSLGEQQRLAFARYVMGGWGCCLVVSMMRGGGGLVGGVRMVCCCLCCATPLGMY